MWQADSLGRIPRSLTKPEPVASLGSGAKSFALLLRNKKLIEVMS